MPTPGDTKPIAIIGAGLVGGAALRALAFHWIDIRRKKAQGEPRRNTGSRTLLDFTCIQVTTKK
jgi:hypothetical protein